MLVIADGYSVHTNKFLCNVRALKSSLSLAPTMGPGHSLTGPLTSDPRNQPLSAYFVMLGTLSSYPQAGEPRELRAVVQFIAHPSYMEMHGRGDIALVQLAYPVTFSDLILPVCLPKPRDLLGQGTWCWVTGWGNIDTNLRKTVQNWWWGGVGG